MKFIHLTDTHLSSEPLYGIDTHARLAAALEHIKKRADGALFAVVTGDIAQAGDVDSYREAARMFAELPMPVFVLPGNHDNEEHFAQVFARADDVLLPSGGDIPAPLAPAKVSAPDFEAVFFNTAQRGKAAGRVREDELAALEALLSRPDPRPLLIFMHHPPFASGIAAMDAAGLENAGDLARVLQMGVRKASGIFCGHLHRTISGLWAGTSVSCLRAVAHEVAPDVHGSVMTGTVEAPEYALVEVEKTNKEEGAGVSILSQTMRFTEGFERFCL